MWNEEGGGVDGGYGMNKQINGFWGYGFRIGRWVDDGKMNGLDGKRRERYLRVGSDRMTARELGVQGSRCRFEWKKLCVELILFLIVICEISIWKHMMRWVCRYMLPEGYNATKKGEEQNYVSNMCDAKPLDGKTALSGPDLQ